MKKIFSFRCINNQTNKHLHFSITAKNIFEAYTIIEKKHKNIIVLDFIGSKEVETETKK